MAAAGIHYMAYAKTKEYLDTVEKEYRESIRMRDLAAKDGDARENSNLDNYKDMVARLSRIREELAPVLTLPVVKSNDNVSIIEEGSVIHLTVHRVTNTPVQPNTAEFEALKEGKPEFEGVLMYGATLSIHDLLSNKALACTSPVGRFILGKQPGDYTVPVPNGFSNITVRKLPVDTDASELRISYDEVV